jgi:tetratricopeptide (TPR) repeat protein
VLVAVGNGALAAGEDAQQLFQEGRAAFERQDHVAALEAFEAAAKANLSGPAVHFNIGVAAFRLGDYDRAERAFREVARTPAMAGLAYYNLGLVELRRGDSQAAANWFARVEQHTAEERLRALAATQLANLPAVPDRNWAGYASVGAGYDDNVALVSDSDVLGVSGLDDSFVEAQFAFSAPLAETWRFDTGIVLVDYLELNQFDQLSAQGGARYRFLADEWTNEVAVQFAYSMLDGEGFENRQILTLQSSRELVEHWRVLARYRFSQIDGMDEFAGVGGVRQEGSVLLNRSVGAWQFGVSYELESSNLDDDALSTTRHQIAADFHRHWHDLWTLVIDTTLQSTRYDEGAGEETRTEVAIAIERALGAGWRVVTRYARADNDSDLPEFNYGRNRISVSIEALL